MQKISYPYRVTVISLAFMQNSMLAGLLFGMFNSFLMKFVVMLYRMDVNQWFFVG